VAALLHERGPIAVGTDSLSSTPDLDLLAEVRFLAALAAEQGYDAPDLAERLLQAATAGGAYAIGRPDLGTIQPGATAAFAHVTVDNPGAPDLAAEVVRNGGAHAAPIEQADSAS
jgi:cytosine/adenosine deaminase-related metal-dependent hydrolase